MARRFRSVRAVSSDDPSFPARPADPIELRIIDWNVQGRKDVARQMDFIDSLGWDVLLFQEVRPHRYDEFLAHPAWRRAMQLSGIGPSGSTRACRGVLPSSYGRASSSSALLRWSTSRHRNERSSAWSVAATPPSSWPPLPRHRRAAGGVNSRRCSSIASPTDGLPARCHSSSVWIATHLGSTIPIWQGASGSRRPKRSCMAPPPNTTCVTWSEPTSMSIPTSSPTSSPSAPTDRSPPASWGAKAKGNSPARYDAIYASPEFKVIDVRYHWKDAIEAGSDHGLVWARLELTDGRSL